MDFLEIRRKAKERAAARAAGEVGRSAPDRPVAAAPGPEVEPRARLALEPLTMPASAPVEVPAAAAGADPIAPALPGAALRPDEPAGPHRVRRRGATSTASSEVAPGSDEARAAAAEAARLEAELAAKLADLPTAPDARFRTWRPTMDQASDLAPIAPEPEPRRERRPSERGTERRPEEAPAPSVGDPLEEFFYRVDEPGPELGVLAGSAPVAPAAPAPVERVEYLTFLLGAEEYGVEIDRIREVMRSPPITEVPRAPPDVLGVITVRGEVVAVYDPRRRLGLRCDPGTGGGRVLIVDDGAGPCGLLVDAVASVVRLPRGTIEPCPQGIGGAAADCLEGIGRERDRLFTVLSIPALLRPVRRVGEGKG